MHQLDQALGEFEAGIDALESSDEFELLGENEGEYEWSEEADTEAVFDEVEEMELAAALLEVRSDEELEQFLGGLIKKAGRAVGGFIRSPVGKALGGALKSVASKALPIAGQALGNLVVPGVGGMIGGKLASAAGRMFGLELEGMSPQDQEFEVARRVVRLAGEATRQAAQTPAQGPPVKVAKDAVLAAAARHAPGLVSRPAGTGAGGTCTCGKPRTGGVPGAGVPAGIPGRPPVGPPRVPGRPPYPGRPSGGVPRVPGVPGGNGVSGAVGAAGAPGGRGPGLGLGQSGTWVRRGPNTIVLSWA